MRGNRYHVYMNKRRYTSSTSPKRMLSGNVRAGIVADNNLVPFTNLFNRCMRPRGMPVQEESP